MTHTALRWSAITAAQDLAKLGYAVTIYAIVRLMSVAAVRLSLQPARVCDCTSRLALQHGYLLPLPYRAQPRRPKPFLHCSLQRSDKRPCARVRGCAHPASHRSAPAMRPSGSGRWTPASSKESTVSLITYSRLALDRVLRSIGLSKTTLPLKSGMNLRCLLNAHPLLELDLRLRLGAVSSSWVHHTQPSGHL